MSVSELENLSRRFVALPCFKTTHRSKILNHVCLYNVELEQVNHHLNASITLPSYLLRE